jgi:hypothetical protein|tara:strand:- start:2916 stop:3491 length:576 start_codon:yes stop_codon:yes gene_type:complete
MNIFILDEDPRTAASMHCDKHVPKMVLESAQMLSTAHRMLDGVETKKRSKSGKTMSKYFMLGDVREHHLYNAVHFNHPCTIWTRESTQNYLWHYELFIALCDEYTKRYGKIHLTDRSLREYLKPTPNNIPNVDMTPFRLAMKSNPECMNESAPVESYRKFYMTKQERFKMEWKNAQTPYWFQTCPITTTAA